MIILDNGGQVKIAKLKIFSIIALFLFLLSIAITIPIVVNYNSNHDHVKGVVIQKEYKEAYSYYYGNQYIFIPEEYIIVAEYEYNGKYYTFNHSVSQTIYHSYNINNKISFCFLHKKLIEYEK